MKNQNVMQDQDAMKKIKYKLALILTCKIKLTFVNFC